MTYTKEQEREVFRNQSEKVQDYILSDELSATIKGVALKFGLTETQSRVLGINTTPLILKILSSDEFVTELSGPKAGIEKEKALQILAEVKEKILSKAEMMSRETPKPSVNFSETQNQTQLDREDDNDGVEYHHETPASEEHQKEIGLLKPEEILKEIENPAPFAMLDDKLAGTVKSPTSTPPSPVAQKTGPFSPNSNSNRAPQTPPPPVAKYKVDPYREPLV